MKKKPTRTVALKTTTPAPDTSELTALPDGGRVYAVVVGIEDYRTTGTDPLKKVDYARNDARGFTSALEAIFPTERLDIKTLIDNDATKSTIEYELRSVIGALEKDDLLVFYYAGHGFHGAGGNRITGWDTNAHHIDTTTVQLRASLFDPFEASRGRRLLAFVDACARNFKESLSGRDVVSDFSSDELKAALSVERYTGIFLSCEPAQASYPADKYQHGTWTYFLLQALHGNAEGALDRDRYLTDRTLRDYLTHKVPAFLRAETEFKGLQRPRAIIDSSRTFAIWQVPERVATPPAEFSDIRVDPEREYFERVETGKVSSLPGFNKRGHFVPDRISDASTGFVRERLAGTVTEEMQGYYDDVKDVFGMKRREISREDDVGQASLSTDYFRFSISAEQDASDPAGYVILRRLELREGGEAKLEEIDQVFGEMFNRLVVHRRGDPLDFDDLVDLLEDLVDTRGGSTRDEPARGRAYYTGPDGTTLTFDTEENWVRLSGGARRQDLRALLTRAHPYGFGSTIRSPLLNGSNSPLGLPSPDA